MPHHISFGVSNIERAATFYDAVLAPLGYIGVWDDQVRAACFADMAMTIP